ncbi:hypothetical protein [Pedobacter kyonggii]|uniref:Uncharacterized protein n=1 Tax=Pedobacter kyonggii TaxID=1926871 RepID=A0A4Q9H3J2_9SPHI|nr:hypothetical protein [Pedobacter kyonggii]TBO35944.1 hypothetical protein EYS08_25390 [Pedobacter kyonggii]
MTISKTYNQPSAKINIYEILDAFGTEIYDLGLLPDGWDSGVGKAISLDMINRALHVYNSLKTAGLDYEVMPFANGTLKLTFALRDHFLIVHVLVDSYNYAYEKGEGFEYEEISENENVSLTQLKDILSEIKNKCSLFVPLTSQNLAVEENVSMIVSRQWVGVSPSLIKNASVATESRYVSI